MYVAALMVTVTVSAAFIVPPTIMEPTAKTERLAAFVIPVMGTVARPGVKTNMRRSNGSLTYKLVPSKARASGVRIVFGLERSMLESGRKVSVLSVTASVNSSVCPRIISAL